MCARSPPVRDNAYRDPDYAANYARRAAELGWFSMLVPEHLGGGSASGNGMMDAALIAYERGRGLQPGPFVGTNVAAYALACGRFGGATHQGLTRTCLLAPSRPPGRLLAKAMASRSPVSGRPAPRAGYELSGQAALVLVWRQRFLASGDRGRR